MEYIKGEIIKPAYTEQISGEVIFTNGVEVCKLLVKLTAINGTK